MRGAKWVFAGSDYTTDFRSGLEHYIPDLTRVVIALAWKFSDTAVIACDHGCFGGVRTEGRLIAA